MLLNKIRSGYLTAPFFSKILKALGHTWANKTGQETRELGKQI